MLWMPFAGIEVDHKRLFLLMCRTGIVFGFAHGCKQLDVVTRKLLRMLYYGLSDSDLPSGIVDRFPVVREFSIG